MGRRYEIRKDVEVPRIHTQSEGSEWTCAYDRVDAGIQTCPDEYQVKLRSE